MIISTCGIFQLPFPCALDIIKAIMRSETGGGYGDILIETEDDAAGIVIGLKYACDGNLENGAKLALEQIEDRRYAEKLYDAGAVKVLKYGIACYKKKCRVLLARRGIWNRTENS